ncbi:hypothetical protein MVEG_07143 [Podila verticillata NRRL 6337]|nr:hypothetical protein MVEG_07143 [Podila verticillata NRRL 6337]
MMDMTACTPSSMSLTPLAYFATAANSPFQGFQTPRGSLHRDTHAVAIFPHHNLHLILVQNICHSLRDDHSDLPA